MLTHTYKYPGSCQVVGWLRKDRRGVQGKGVGGGGGERHLPKATLACPNAHRDSLAVGDSVALPLEAVKTALVA